MKLETNLKHKPYLKHKPAPKTIHDDFGYSIVRDSMQSWQKQMLAWSEEQEMNSLFMFNSNRRVYNPWPSGGDKAILQLPKYELSHKIRVKDTQTSDEDCARLMVVTASVAQQKKRHNTLLVDEYYPSDSIPSCVPTNRENTDV